MRRWLKMGLSALIGAGALTASVLPGAAADLETVHFVYDWPSADFELIPVVAAQEQGFYKDAGLKVDVVFPPDSQTTGRMLATGDGDIGFETTTDVVFAATQGIPIVSIGLYSQSNNWGLFGRPGEPVSLDTLKGKKIAIFTDSWTKAMMPFVLKAAHLTDSDVQLIIAQDNDISLLLSGKIDIATNTSNYAIPEVQAAVHKDPTMLIGPDAGIPDTPIWTYTASRKWLETHGDTAKKWLAATKKGMEWASAHQDEAVALFAKAYPQAGAADYSKSGWAETVPLLKGKNGYMMQSDQDWLPIANALKATGQIKTVLPADKYYTNDYLK